MTKEVELFNSEDDLARFTGLSHEDLRENCFLTNDLEIGIRVKVPFEDNGVECEFARILAKGYWHFNYVEYGGYVYFSVHNDIC
ncbi:MAG: hypothetical protein LUE27_11625 [Clostridia bacterium]|nr:hypothetical protein [Clostridia bacterium]